MTKTEEIKKELKKLPREHYWQIDEDTGQILHDTIIKLNAKNALEVGTSSGYSSLWMIEALIHTGGHLFTIESHKGRFELGEQTFKRAKVEQYVTHINGHAPEDIPLDKRFDFVFLDGVKKEAARHLDTILPTLTSGATVIVDNVKSHEEKFAPFFDYLVQKGLSCKIDNVGNGLAIIQF